MKRRALAVSMLGVVAAFLLLGSPLASAQPGEHVDLIKVNGVIDPFTAQYVERGLGVAQSDGAQCLIIQLDTPGGSDAPMRVIVQEMLNSTVPTVAYVAPAGARAGSAGVFITMAANIAAMAPGTNIGAAHPVDITGAITGTVGEKVTNDAAAYIRAIAEKRGRNAEWAEEAVRESVSIIAREAVESQVADLIADDLEDLLDKIDGREVITAAGPVTLRTRGAPVRTIGMNFAENFLHVIVDPNIAYLLLSIGTLALTAEFYHPGAIFPGVTGAICLILAFVAFGSLPVNWGGVALIVLAVVLFIVDIKVAGFMLSVGGAIAFVLGSLMLFSPFASPSPTMPHLTVSWPLIILMTASITSFFLFALSAGLLAQRAKAASGIESMVGATGTAVSDLDPWGTVQVKSELWSAVAEEGSIKKGERVRVVGAEGVRLKVTKK